MNERRYFASELEARSTDTGKAVIAGYAAVFGTNSKNLGGFVEQVGSNAFKRTINRNDDVRAYLNHDPNFILGRTASGTLKLSTDATGLYYEVEAPNTSYARDLMAVIERRDVTQSSFAFSVSGPDGESWDYTEDGFPQRTLNEVRLYDVSPVANPAYEDTTTALGERSLEALCELRGISPERVADLPVEVAVRALLKGEELEEEEQLELIDAAEEEPAEEERSEGASAETRNKIAVARARIELLARPSWK